MHRQPRVSIPSLLLPLVIGGLIALPAALVMQWVGQAEASPRETPLASSEGQAGAPPIGAPTRRETRFKVIRSFLIIEGQEAMRIERLQYLEPNIATRERMHANREDVSKAMVVTQHAVPFVDTYIRWQLISYKPLLVEMSDNTFTTFLKKLPNLADDPRSSADALEVYRRAEGTTITNDVARERLEAMDERLRSRSLMAQELLVPSMGLREWFFEKLGKEDERHLLLRFEMLESMIRAGWAPDRVVEDTEKHINAAMFHGTLNRQECMRAAQGLLALRNVEREYIIQFGFDIGSTAYVQRGVARVPAETLRHWEDLLLGVVKPTPIEEDDPSVTSNDDDGPRKAGSNDSGNKTAPDASAPATPHL